MLWRTNEAEHKRINRDSMRCEEVPCILQLSKYIFFKTFSAGVLLRSIGVAKSRSFIRQTMIAKPHLLSLCEDISKAADRIKLHVRKTPLEYSPWLSDVGKSKVYIKLGKYSNQPLLLIHGNEFRLDQSAINSVGV